MQQKKISKKSKIVTETDDFGRQKFSLKQSSQPEESDHQQKFIDTGRYASTLIGRDQKIDTNKHIGRIASLKKNKKTEVFYCEVCKLGFKCDIAYITHVNSASHNRKLGMNMKVQAVSVETVTQKLTRMAMQKNKSKAQIMFEKKAGKKLEELQNGSQQNHNHQEIEAKQKKQQIKQEHKKQQQNEQQEQEEQQEDPTQKMMRQMGLPTSLAYKKKY